MRELLQQALGALKEWDALIKHQYTGTSEGMSDMQHAAWHTVDVIAALEQELAKPEQVYDHESDAMSVLADVNADLIRDAKPEPIYVMGNYAGEGKVVSASFGLPKGAFDTPESHIALEAELAKQTALDKKADNARELKLDYEPEQEEKNT